MKIVDKSMKMYLQIRQNWLSENNTKNDDYFMMVAGSFTKMKCLNVYVSNYMTSKIWEVPPSWIIYKNFVFILTYLNFSHLQSAFHLMQYTYWDVFSFAQNNFWTCWLWCLLVLLLFFCFNSSPSAKHFPLKNFFIQGNKKMSLGIVALEWIGRMEHGSHVVFGPKLPIMEWAGALINDSSRNGQTLWKSLK